MDMNTEQRMATNQPTSQPTEIIQIPPQRDPYIWIVMSYANEYIS